MTWRRDEAGEWVRQDDEVHRCACGHLVRRCCEDCLRTRCGDCGERVKWRAVETHVVEAADGQATVDEFAGGGTA